MAKDFFLTVKIGQTANSLLQYTFTDQFWMTPMSSWCRQYNLFSKVTRFSVQLCGVLGHRLLNSNVAYKLKSSPSNYPQWRTALEAWPSPKGKTGGRAAEGEGRGGGGEQLVCSLDRRDRGRERQCERVEQTGGLDLKKGQRGGSFYTLDCCWSRAVHQREFSKVHYRRQKMFP